MFQRLLLVEWVFRIEIETCRHCGVAVKVTTRIENPVVIKRILDHLDQRAEKQPLALRLAAQAPLRGEPLDLKD